MGLSFHNLIRWEMLELLVSIKSVNTHPRKQTGPSDLCNPHTYAKSLPSGPQAAIRLRVPRVSHGGQMCEVVQNPPQHVKCLDNGS